MALSRVVSVSDDEIAAAVGTFYNLAIRDGGFLGKRRQLERLCWPKTPEQHKQHRRLGRWLVRKYRKDVGASGIIDWQKFHEWLKEHLPEIALARLVVSVLMLLLVL